MSKRATKKALRAAAGRLRAARDLMNSGGMHWIKGAERMLVDETHEPGEHGLHYPGYTDSGGYETAYCSIGALHEIGADGIEFITLAELLDPERMRDTRARYADGIDREEARCRELGYAFDREREEEDAEYYVLEEAKDVIVAFNDAACTSWDDVRGAFTRAAKRLVDRAR